MLDVAASFACEIQEWADSVNSGQSLPGRILVVFVWLCNLMSMVSGIFFILFYSKSVNWCPLNIFWNQG